jgi:outer membrane lipoprotein LolB
MSRLRSHTPWRCLALVLSLVLSACATRPVAAPRSLDVERQRSLLLQLEDFSFAGRVAISGQDGVPSMQWEQRGDATRVKLSGLIGSGMQVDYSPGQLRLVTTRGEKLQDGEAEEALTNAMSFVPPFDSLRYWMLGVPAPDANAPVARFDAQGLLQQLEQQDWIIVYEGRKAVNTAAGTLQMPAKLVATRGELRLRLVIDRWRINIR